MENESGKQQRLFIFPSSLFIYGKVTIFLQNFAAISATMPLESRPVAAHCIVVVISATVTRLRLHLRS